MNHSDTATCIEVLRRHLNHNTHDAPRRLSESLEPIKLIIIGDFGKDLDDEQTLILAAGLQRAGLVNILAVIANLEPARARAQLARGTFNMLHISEVTVGAGTDCFCSGRVLPHELSSPYMATRGIIDGTRLLVNTLRAAHTTHSKVTIVCNSGLTDAAKLLMNEPELVAKTVTKFVIMGDVQTDGDNILPVRTPNGVTGMMPSEAANNAFDWGAALFLYQKLQDMGIPMIITTRHAAYAAKCPFSAFERFAATDNPIGTSLFQRQSQSIEALWQRVHLPSGSEARGDLPSRCDRAWFIETFCAGNDPGEGPIWPRLTGYQQYDPLTVLAAVPTLSDWYFSPTEITVHGVTHSIIGVSKENYGVSRSEHSSIADFMVDMEVAALRAAITS